VEKKKKKENMGGKWRRSVCSTRRTIQGGGEFSLQREKALRKVPKEERKRDTRSTKESEGYLVEVGSQRLSTKKRMSRKEGMIKSGAKFNSERGRDEWERGACNRRSSIAPSAEWAEVKYVTKK